MSSHVPQVLFLCVHNAGRSQMAAALLEREAQGRVKVLSAGSAPGETVNPAAVEVMREIGLDIASNQPKALDYDEARTSDLVITMGCGDACPVFPGVRYMDWELDDPAGQPLDVVRRIRDEIAERVRHLVQELAAPHP